MRELTRRLIEGAVPLLAVCLGHQVLCGLLGLDLVPRDVPNQGTQHEIDFFGRPERCGFYNTFVAVTRLDEIPHPWHGGPISVARDRSTGEVHALRGAGLSSLQFHPESVLTEHGVDILRQLATGLLPVPDLSSAG
jgi:phenazine biosynthesis protein phzE